MKEGNRRTEFAYEGWAPCVHTPEQQAAFTKWLADVMTDMVVMEEVGHGGALESLLWMLNDLGPAVTLVCDQWTACICEGMADGALVKTRVQGDTFLASVAESYRWWREKTETQAPELA